VGRLAARPQVAPRAVCEDIDDTDGAAGARKEKEKKRKKEKRSVCVRERERSRLESGHAMVARLSRGEAAARGVQSWWLGTGSSGKLRRWGWGWPGANVRELVK
jgi:hypothetical protein